MITIKKYNEGMDGDGFAVSEPVAKAVRKLAQAKQLEAQAKGFKEQANGVIEEFHYITGARTFSVEGVGEVTAYTGESTRFDKTKMALALVGAGVHADVIDEAMKAATTVKVNGKLTVRFKPE